MALSLETARADGLPLYFTGEPCKNGHVARRRVANRGCVECLRNRNRKWMKKDREENYERRIQIERASRKRAKERLGEYGWHRRSKEGNLKFKYGLSLREYEGKLKEQRGVCAICGSSPPPTKKNKGYLHVDHDHESGEIRGLLCHRCNQGMAAVDSCSDWPEKAAMYAAKYRRA